MSLIQCGEHSLSLQWGEHSLSLQWGGHSLSLQWGGHSLSLQWGGHSLSLQWGGHSLSLQWEGTHCHYSVESTHCRCSTLQLWWREPGAVGSHGNLHHGDSGDSPAVGAGHQHNLNRERFSEQKTILKCSGSYLYWMAPPWPPDYSPLLCAALHNF